MAAILKTCGFKVTWFIRHTCVRHVAMRSYKGKTSHFALAKQDPWKTQTAGISPQRSVICSKKSSYEEKVSGKKVGKPYIIFFSWSNPRNLLIKTTLKVIHFSHCDAIVTTIMCRFD